MHHKPNKNIPAAPMEDKKNLLTSNQIGLKTDATNKPTTQLIKTIPRNFMLLR